MQRSSQESDKIRALALGVLEIEAAAIHQLKTRIDESFVEACYCLLGCEGRIVVTGMGKSGHIGKKIAATLASTGSPAFFVHPGEASHGDLGMITAKDVVLALSNSGETDEVLLILPLLKRLGVPLIVLVGRPASTLAREANFSLDVSVDKEACPLGLAPTASTTAALAMGDALAIALLEARGFTAQDFALAHPGGALGRRLLLRVDELMRVGAAVPKVQLHAPLGEALMEMTQKGLGMTTVLDEQGEVIGLFTDGDLRRVMDQHLDLQKTEIKEVMVYGGKKIALGTLAAEAVKIMEDHHITSLLVVNAQQAVVGIIHMHDLLRAKVV
jgi:arabinose-5-phosphate isomerase